MNSTSLQALVARFLSWPVPADVYPDGTPGQPGRTGTNLMNATQAEQMLLHVLAEPEDHRDRVRAEHADLTERTSKLNAFFATEAFAALPADEQDRMHAQFTAMCEYASCLRQRIAAFSV